MVIPSDAMSVWIILLGMGLNVDNFFWICHFVRGALDGG